MDLVLPHVSRFKQLPRVYKKAYNFLVHPFDGVKLEARHENGDD